MFSYDDGVFYQKEGVEYVVIDPPLGVDMRKTPLIFLAIILSFCLFVVILILTSILETEDDWDKLDNAVIVRS